MSTRADSVFANRGPLPALALNAFTYLVSQGSLAAVDTFGPDEPAGLPSFRAIASDIATGFRFLWRDAAMGAISCVSLGFNFFGFMTAAAFIPFLKRDFGASDPVVGYALGIASIGAPSQVRTSAAACRERGGLGTC
ncbi:MAG: hypothetical protein ACLPSH_14675 [Vulcanimicrobiaceae bacterium]